MAFQKERRAHYFHLTLLNYTQDTFLSYASADRMLNLKTSLKEKNLPVDHNWLLHPLPRLLATSSFVIPLRHGALSDNYLDLIALFL